MFHLESLSCQIHSGSMLPQRQGTSKLATRSMTTWFSSAMFVLYTLFVLHRSIAFVIFVIIEIVCLIATTLAAYKIYIQKRNSSTKTTSCAKWQHVKHCEYHKVCSMYNLHLSRILGLLSPLYYHYDYWNVLIKYDHGSAVYVLWNHKVSQFVVKPHHLLLKDEACS